MLRGWLHQCDDTGYNRRRKMMMSRNQTLLTLGSLITTISQTTAIPYTAQQNTPCNVNTTKDHATSSCQSLVLLRPGHAPHFWAPASSLAYCELIGAILGHDDLVTVMWFIHSCERVEWGGCSRYHKIRNSDCVYARLLSTGDDNATFRLRVTRF